MEKNKHYNCRKRKKKTHRYAKHNNSYMEPEEHIDKDLVKHFIVRVRRRIVPQIFCSKLPQIYIFAVQILFF